jgi:hypothetical protein
LVDLWADTKIQPGQDWRTEIRSAVQRAAVAVLLVSADFLASDFIAENELPPLLAAAERDGVRILPVVLKPCAFADLPALAKFQGVNNLKKPLISLPESEREEIWYHVARTVRDALSAAGTKIVEPEEPQTTRQPYAIPEEVEFHFGEELNNPRVLRQYYVYSYEHLDTSFFMKSAPEVLEGVPNRHEILREIEQRLLGAGWEGDGDLEVMWLPPFVGAGVEDTSGVSLWHVKQDNNGTSWIASPVPLPFKRLEEQNRYRSPAPELGSKSESSRGLRGRRRPL